MPRITTNDGVGLNYLDEGSGLPIVLIAGYTLAAESWALQVPDLVAAGHRVLCLDRRSHGRSGHPLSGQRMARHGKDLADFLAALDLRGAVLVGGSMGASAIWAYADLFGAERTRAVVSIDQTPKMINDGSWEFGFYGLTRSNVGHFFDEGVPDTGRGQPRTTSIQRTMQLLAALPEPPVMGDPIAPETRWLLQDHATQDWRDVVDGLDAEILMVAARDSQLWPCEHATSTENPRAHAVILEDCGHAANFDQPKAFNAALLEFVSGL